MPGKDARCWPLTSHTHTQRTMYTYHTQTIHMHTRLNMKTHRVSISYSETVAERLLNLPNRTNNSTWHSQPCQAEFSTNAACSPTVSYPVRATILPPPPCDPHFYCSHSELKAENGSLEALTNHRKINKPTVSPLQNGKQYERQKGQRMTSVL